MYSEETNRPGPSVFSRDENCSLDSIIIDKRKLEHLAFTQIRKTSVDPYNRLHSIDEDARFVRVVYDNYKSQGYPLLANLRCGAWYADPSYTSETTAYFKSSDGHYNGWSFNLRRPNLHILPLINAHKGVMLVDSTRAGKRMPDSFSKTVPIWCAVINRALQLRNLIPISGSTESEKWDTELHTAPQSVSKSEHSQIEERIDAWAEALADSSYDLPSLPKPLRPIWVTPATTSLPEPGDHLAFYPIICISASKLVNEGLERRREGYSYVQGSGDDHEHWSSGLIPALFWEHRDELLSVAQEDIVEVIRKIISESQASASSGRTKEWLNAPVSIKRINGLLTLCSTANIPASVLEGRQTPPFPCIVLQTSSKQPNAPESPRNSECTSTSHLFRISIPTDKKAAERTFKTSLSNALDFVEQNLRDDQQVCIACETGKDLSVGIAVAALQAFFDDDEKLDLMRRTRKDVIVNKDTLRTRLQWVIASKPDANPSRATLKRVNEFFMSASYKS